MLKCPPCAVCEGKTMRIPIPSDEMGPYLSARNAVTGDFRILGKVDEVPEKIINKYRMMFYRLVEVVPVQFGCTDKCYAKLDELGNPQPSIMTYWMRKDGKEGDLYRDVKARDKGIGRPLMKKIPGNLNEIMG